MTPEERFVQIKANIAKEFGQDEADQIEKLAKLVGIEKVSAVYVASEELGRALEQLRDALTWHFNGGTRH